MLTLVQGLPVNPSRSMSTSSARDLRVREIGLKGRLQQLAHIEQVLDTTQWSDVKPWRTARAWSWGAFAVGTAVMARVVLWSYGGIESLNLHMNILGADRMPMFVAFAPFVIAAFVSLIGWVTAKTNAYPLETGQQWLSDVLADYEPLDRAAYKKLQDASRRNGSIEHQQVREWMAQEHLAIEIQESIGDTRGARLGRFLRKQV